MPAINLEDRLDLPPNPNAIPDEGVSFDDYMRSVASGAYGVAGTIGGAGEYLTGGPQWRKMREFGEAGSREQIEKMGTGAARAMRASVLPGQGEDIWDAGVSTGHAVGLRLAGATPSLVASMLPGGIVARVALAGGATAGAAGTLGTGVGMAAAGVQTGGDVFNQIMEEVGKTPDKELQDTSPAYRGLRGMGMEEEEAKKFLGERAAGYKPLIMAGITALTSKYGVESMVAHRAAGEGGRGILRSAGIGLAGEASQEAIEDFSGELLTQKGVAEAKGVDVNYDWMKALEAAASGALVGGITGGAVGGATARRKTRDEILAGKPKPEDREEPEVKVPVGVAKTPVSSAQSTPSVLAEVRAKVPGGRDAVVAEQNNPVKAGEEMGAAIAQKPPEEHGGVDLKPEPAVSAVTPAPLSADPEHVVALTAPAAVPQTAKPQPSKRQSQLDLIAQAEKELLGPTVIRRADLLEPDGSFNGQAAEQRVSPQIQQALDRGAKVTLWLEGKPIPITSIDRGMMADAQGQRWGLMPVAMPSGKNDDRIEIGQSEAIPPIPAHSVVTPEIAAAITHERATSIAQGTINAKLEEARATQNAPRPDPAAALAAAAAPAPTGAIEPTPAATAVAPAAGVAGAAPAAAATTVAETPVASIPSEVIPPPVAEPPVKRKPGRPRKNTADPAIPGQSGPMTAEEKDALHKRVTDEAVTRLADIIRTREDSLRGIADVEVAKPIVDKAKAAIDEIVTEAAKIIGKRKASVLAHDARRIVNAEKKAAPRPEPTGQVLESAVETKEVADARPIPEIIAELQAENPNITTAAAVKQALALRRGKVAKVVARTPEVIAKERKGPRTSAIAKEQIAAGETEVLSAEERDRREQERADADAADRMRQAMENNPYDPSDLATIKPQRAYIRTLLDAVGKTRSLANLPADSDQHLKHLAAAKRAVRDFSDDAEETMIDFMSADYMLRQGKDPYAAAPVVTGAAFDEQAAAQADVEAAGGVNVEAEKAETAAARFKVKAIRARERGREAKKIKRERAEILAHRAKLREEGPAEPEPQVVKVEKKARLTPAEIKARAAASRAAQTRVADAVERGEASPRTEEQAIRQIETIRLEESADAFGKLADDVEQMLNESGLRDRSRLVDETPDIHSTLQDMGAKRVSARDLKLDEDDVAGVVITPDGKIYQLYRGDQPTDSSHDNLRKTVTGSREKFIPGVVEVRLARRADRPAALGATVGTQVTIGEAKLPQILIDRVQQIARANGISTLFAQAASSTTVDISGRADGQQPSGFLPFDSVIKPLSEDRSRRLRRVQDTAPASDAVLMEAADGDIIELTGSEPLRNTMQDLRTDYAPADYHTMTQELAKIFDKFVGNTPVYWITQQQMTELDAKDTQGFYDQTNKVIVLNDAILNRSATHAVVVMHEAAHAALFDILETNPQAAITVTKMAHAVRAALKAHGITEKSMGKGDLYGLVLDEHGNPNPHEFMSEALANPRFQHMLAGIEATQELKDETGIDKPKASMWDVFVGAARRWLGASRNMVSILDVALRHADNILSDDGKSVLVRAPSRAPRMRRVSPSDFKDGMDDRLAATSLNVSRWGKMVQTVDQIVRGARSLFEGRAPDDLHDALAMMDKQATDGSIASVRLAAKWIEWSRQNKEAARPAANLAMLAVRNDIDPRKPKDQDKSLTGDKFREYQRVARYDEIKAKWDALPADARAILDEMFDHHTSIARGLAKARAKSLIDTWLEATGTSLTDMERDALTQRVLAGTLTEKGSDQLKPGQQSDEELIGNDEAFRDLQSVELRLPTIYLPHMRHGNIVVRTKEKLPDLMGGKLLEESDKHAVVEFSGPNARDEYEAWAKSPAMVDGPDIISVNNKRYLTPSGEEVSEVDSRGQPHEVRIEARVLLQGLYAFDKGRDAAAFIREAKAAGGFAEIEQKPLQRANSYDEGTLPPSQLNGLLRGIERRKGLDENTKNLLKATVESAAIRLMPGHRIQQRMLKREGVRGASEDLSRSLISYGTTASEALARLENMPAVRKALETMRSQIGKVGAKDAQQQSLVVGELTKRVYDNVVHPQDTARWMQDLLRLSQLDKLASPAYTIINGMQPWMVTLPVLGSEHGNMRATAEMGRAYKDVGFGSVFRGAFGNMAKATRNFTKFGIDINNPIESVLRKLANVADGSRLIEGLRKVISLGMIQETAGIETGSGGPPGGKARTIADGVDRIARQLPIAIEAINRAVSFIAAYRLAYAQSGNHDMAVQYGIDIINRTQFNYAAWNKPGFFNKPWLRPALQFKAYAQGMTALLADATYKTFKGATKKEKQQAFKLLMNIVGVQVAMAGAMGLPGIELIKASFMIAAMLGLGGGWDDAERWLRKVAEDAFGKTTGELLSKGVLSRAAGVDLSSRLGLSDMWLFGEPKMYDRQGSLAYFGQLVMGAPGGLILDWSEGLRAAGQGDFAKSFELMMPVKFISDTASAARGRFDPNSKSPLSTSDAVLKSIGFRSGAAVERSFEKGKTIQLSKDMNAKARELERDYLQASTAGERVRIKARILTHNKEMNEKKLGLKQKALSPKTLDGIRERRKAERSRITGDE